MDAQLRAADAANEMLTFVVVVPHWPDKRAWKALRALPSCRSLVQLAQAEHGYFEGAQQYRDALWRPANHDSSLFFLMSGRAHAACPVTAARSGGCARRSGGRRRERRFERNIFCRIYHTSRSPRAH